MISEGAHLHGHHRSTSGSVDMCLTAMPTLLHKIQQATIYGAKLTTATVSTGAIQQQGPQQHSCRGTILQLELQLHSSYGNQAWHETTVKCGHGATATARAAATATATARAVATVINHGRHTGHAPRSTRGMQCGTAAGNRGVRVG